MTVHIREFVLRLGAEERERRGGETGPDAVTRRELEALRRELLRQVRDSAAETRPQPFDR